MPVIYMIISLLVKIFGFYPMDVGCRSFFILGQSEKPRFEQVISGFTGNYWNVVKVQFLRALFTFLWSLLFIIPGIIKMYEYRMIPYILAENPNLSRKEVFLLSKEMTRGQKWKAFVFDISFIGWWLLGLITLGILVIFYVQPYYNAACAELYITLRDRMQEIPPENPV